MKFKDKLNPKIWTGFNLKPEVKDKLKEISDAFTEYLDIPSDAIKDIRITGSSANYNYTPHSDIDLHLIVDYDKVHEDCPVVEGYLWSMKSQFNDDHDINIYDIPVELYAEDSRTQAVSNGVYSLTRDKWLKKPEKIPPTDNDNAVNAKFNELKDAIDKCDDSEEAQKLLDKIYQMRKSGLSEHGEFSTENLAFKKLRDSGKLQKLKELKKQKIDKQLSLEGRNKMKSTIRSIKECIKKANEEYDDLASYELKKGRTYMANGDILLGGPEHLLYPEEIPVFKKAGFIDDTELVIPMYTKFKVVEEPNTYNNPDTIIRLLDVPDIEFELRDNKEDDRYTLIK